MPINSCIYSIAGTNTFRPSSSGIEVNYVTHETLGTNLENIEKSVRRIYVPKKGYKLCQVDQSGAEALIVAYLCRKGQFRELFLENIKPHVFVAMHMFKDQLQAKIKNDGLDIKCDITELCKTPIAELKRHPFFKPVEKLIKASDNWRAEERYYYIGKQVCHSCVDDKTQVLTKQGWKFINSVKEDEAIAVWNTNQQIHFEVPSHYLAEDFDGEMYQIDKDEINQCVTPNHTIPYTSNNKWFSASAQELSLQKEIRIPNSGYYIGGNLNLPEYEIQLLVAIQADAHITSTKSVRFRFQKERKIERLREILKRGGYNYTAKRTDATEFVVHDIDHIIARFGEKKEWGSWLLGFSKQNLSLLIDELKYWDGTYEEGYCHKREAYFSNNVTNIRWIKTICHLVGKQGTIGETYENCIALGINNRQLARAKIRRKVYYKGKVYCPTVSTGFFLIRRDLKISITGNSNYGIREHRFCMNTLQKSKGKIVINKDEAKNYLSLYHSLFPEIREWHRDTERQVRDTGILYNLQGYPREFNALFDKENDLKEALAFVPQSTVACITHIATTNFQHKIEDENLPYDILTNTYDSYLAQCPESMDTDCCRTMHTLMTNQELTSPRGEKFYMKAEAQSGRNWAPYHPDKNPDGLEEVFWN